MRTISLAVALLLQSTQAIHTNSNIHSKVMMNIKNQQSNKNQRLDAWNEVYKNVNDHEYMQSEENSMNEQVLGQNLHMKSDGESEAKNVDQNSVADIINSNMSPDAQDKAIKGLYQVPVQQKADDTEGNTLTARFKEKKEPSDQELGLDDSHKSHELLQQSIMDPTAGDIPNNSEQADVVANILGAATDVNSQKKMIESITDDHKATGHTKAPKIPVASVNVSDVESKPDPNHVDPNPEVIDEADTTQPIVEIAPEIVGSLAAAQKSKPNNKNLRAEMLAEVNKDQIQFQNENSSFLAIKQKQSQEIVDKVSNMNKEIDEFSHTLDMKHYESALSLQQQLKKDGLRDHEKLMSVNTKDVFKRGFKQFPQIAQNEYVQDQLSILEAAEDNLNGNMINPRLVQALVDRGHEVAGNLAKEYGEQWENPLK